MGSFHLGSLSRDSSNKAQKDGGRALAALLRGKAECDANFPLPLLPLPRSQSGSLLGEKKAEVTGKLATQTQNPCGPQRTKDCPSLVDIGGSANSARPSRYSPPIGTGSNLLLRPTVLREGDADAMLTGTWLEREKLLAGLFFLLLLLLLLPPPELTVLPPDTFLFRRLFGACLAGSAAGVKSGKGMRNSGVWK